MKKYHWKDLVQEYREGGYQNIRQFAEKKGYQNSSYFRQKMRQELASGPGHTREKEPSPPSSPTSEGERAQDRIQGIWDNLLCIIDRDSKGENLSTHEVYELARTLDAIQKAKGQAEKSAEEEPVTKLIQAIDEAARKLP